MFKHLGFQYQSMNFGHDIYRNGDSVMDTKTVSSWVRQFKEGKMSLENKPMEPRARTSRSGELLHEGHNGYERPLFNCGTEQFAASIAKSVGSVLTILHAT